MSKEESLSDLGDPVFAHWELYGTCELTAPGDLAVEEVRDVTCPACLKRFSDLKDNREKARLEHQWES